MSYITSMINKLCIEKGLTLDELANEVNIQRNAFSDLAEAQIVQSISILSKIADFFHISIDQLVGHHSSNAKTVNRVELHDICNKLAAIRSTGNSLTNLLPILENSYKSSVKASLIENSLPENAFILIQSNITNLITVANYISNILGLNLRNQP